MNVEKEREVAGLRCSQVLAILSQYLDGELEAHLAARVEEHVRGCDWCRQFGKEFSAVVTSLKQKLAEAEPLERPVAERLWSELEARL
jgi:predicted anti-sigma-YlaC factor YlaD